MNQTAQETVDKLNSLLGTYDKFYVYAMITNPETDVSAVGIGHVTKFFAHPANKRFRVGVEISFDNHLYTTPSGAGGKITEAVREAVGMPAPKPNNNFDGWNRLWFVIPSNVYSEDNPRWLRMRFRTFLTRGMREAKVPFRLPKICNTTDANDIYTVISSSAGDPVVQLTTVASSSRRRKRIHDADDLMDEDDGGIAAADTARSTMPHGMMAGVEKRLKLVPPRLQRYMTALYTLSGTDTPDGAMSHVQQSCPDTLVEQLGIGLTECRELHRTAKLMLRGKSQAHHATAAV